MKLKKMREERAKKAGTAKKDGAVEGSHPSEIRVQRDLSEWEDVPGAVIQVPDPNRLMELLVLITPQEGLYKGATFEFSMVMDETYPYKPPKVLCRTPVYHPNVDLEGHVCLNILRQEWSAALSISSVVYGLVTLFLEPNTDDPLNKEAAKMMQESPKEFEKTVHKSLQGGTLFGISFSKLL